MIDTELISSLDTKDKDKLLEGLELLIKQTYDVENEFKELRSLFLEIIEVIPVAICVFGRDSSVFLKNTDANNLMDLFLKLNSDNDFSSNSEIEYGNRYYSFKMRNSSDKTIMVLTDISDEKRRERLASMGQVAAHLTHEIRNPIGSVSLLISTLFKKVDLNTKPIVLEMKKSIWRVERIIKATLLFTKGVYINRENFALGELIDDIDIALGNYSYASSIDISMNIDPDIVINADKDLISIVLQNLIFNAIDAIEELDIDNGAISIKYSAVDGKHRFSIVDNGKEIADKNLLFNAFHTTKLRGNGLGLALSMQIAEAHGGKILIETEPYKNFTVEFF